MLMPVRPLPTRQNLEPIGEAIRDAVSAGTVTRDQLFVTSKVWPTQYGPGRVEASIRRMLRQSQLDYFDLVLLHWPVVMADSDSERYPLDAATGRTALGSRPLTDVWRDLEAAHRLGLARSIGVSNFNRRQLQRVLSVASVAPVTNQVECHLYLQQRQLTDLCARHGVVITAYCPLARGGRGSEQDSLLNDDRLRQVSARCGASPAQVAIRWLLDRGIVAIPKSVNPDRIRSNFEVFGFELSPEDRRLLDSMDRGKEGRFVQFQDAAHSPEYPFHLEF